MNKDKIVIKGAREHNLKNIDIEIPKNKFVVITGVSGSGKSSLAFDTIYSEGQRRYVESLSAYARQFIGQMSKPDVDSIEGLAPAISIEQKTTNKNPRSIVGTMTEVYDYMRLLYAHVGTAHCPICDTIVKKQSVDEIIDIIKERSEVEDKVIVLSPVVKEKKGTHKNLFINLIKRGFVRARVNGDILYLEDEINLDKNKKHTIEVVIDRLISKDSDEFITRLTDGVEKATELAEGRVIININGKDHSYSENFTCPNHEDLEFPDINPRLFSFNAPYGACPECNGLGKKMEVDPNKLILDKNLSILEGGIYIPGMATKKGYSWLIFESMAKAFKIDLNKPVKKLTERERNIIFYGDNTKDFHVEYIGREFNYNGRKYFEGLVNIMERRYYETNSESTKDEIENKYMINRICKKCNGKRLRDEVLAIKIKNQSIMDVSFLSIKKALKFFQELRLTPKEETIAKEILKEIRERLNFMINVGLDYLSLGRETRTLSGGESQRIRLATQIGSGLTGVLYVLDEPSIGLHQRDNDKLLKTLNRLKELGNTLIVVEHDEDTMLQSDYIFDMGPGAGRFGGEIVAKGTPKQIMKNSKSMTGKFLKGSLGIELPEKRRKSAGNLELKGAKGNNLKNVDIKIPLGVMTAVTGVSGSGKSTLINQTLYPVLFNALNKGKLYPLEYKSIKGMENLNKVIDINQSPIGRTPRSNTATYTKIFDEVRGIFAETKEAKIRGYKKGRFSFNVKGGRCETCQGAGIIKIEMNFLPDVFVECEVCKGKRYNRETLEIQYKGKNIAEVLDLSVEEAYELFEKIPSLERKLKVLKDVGLDYIKLGQPATTLSGGEAQRIKLATELSKMSRGKTIYILDEPTTGLHFEDIRKLLEVLNRLIEKGNTVVVIEHNLDVIKTADYIIDIGPEGGDGGGMVVAKGTPEKIAKDEKSHTGKYLKKLLKKK